MVLKLVAVAAVALAVATGCTGGEDGAAPSVQHASSPHRPRPGDLPMDGAILDDGHHYIWREVNNGAEDQHNLSDGVGRGSFAIRIACEGGTMRVWIGGSAKTTVHCTGAPVSVYACSHRAALIAHAEWLETPHWDYVWQVAKRGDVCRPIDRDDA